MVILDLLSAPPYISDAVRQQLDALNDEMDAAKASLYERAQLFANIYLTPTQARRWYLYFRLGSIKAVAAAEKVSTTAVSKSLIGNSPHEKSKTRMRSPVEKMKDIVGADPEIQTQLQKIREISSKINYLLESV
jgi:hypothetical protein